MLFRSAARQTDPRAKALLTATHAAKPRVTVRDVDATARRDGDVVTIVAKGLRLEVTPNARLDHHAVAKLRRHEKETIARALAGVTPPPGPWSVSIVREGKRLLDDDNATASAKATRDAIAAWLHVDDGDTARVRFMVSQRRTQGYGVHVVVTGGASL